MDLWITIAASILSAVVGALLGMWGTWLAMRHQLNRQESYDRNKIKLERLERLYQMVSRYTYGVYTMMNESSVKGLRKMVSVIIPPEMMPQRAERKVDIPDDDEMRSIVRIHEPGLTNEMEALLSAGADLCEMILRAEGTSLLAMIEDKETPKHNPQALAKQFEKVYLAAEQLQNSILEKCKDYA